jgi:hypothetical protein
MRLMVSLLLNLMVPMMLAVVLKLIQLHQLIPQNLVQPGDAVFSILPKASQSALREMQLGKVKSCHVS